MGEQEMVNVLQQYRHDIMNQLQIVQGYLSMGKVDKVEVKMEELLRFFHEERKLMGLKAPKFALWIIQFSHRYDNLILSYKVHTESKELQHADDFLEKQCYTIIESFLKVNDASQLYEVELQIEEQLDSLRIIFNFSTEGTTSRVNSFKINEKTMEQNNEIHVIETTNGIVCSFSAPCE